MSVIERSEKFCLKQGEWGYDKIIFKTGKDKKFI